MLSCFPPSVFFLLHFVCFSSLGSIFYLFSYASDLDCCEADQYQMAPSVSTQKHHLVFESSSESKSYISIQTIMCLLIDELQLFWQRLLMQISFCTCSKTSPARENKPDRPVAENDTLVQQYHKAIWTCMGACNKHEHKHKEDNLDKDQEDLL